MSTLYQIQTEYRDLMRLADEIITAENPTEEDLEYLNRLLSINAENFTEKVEAYASVIREKNARAEALRDEAARMQALAKQEEAIAARLQERISAAMIEQGFEKVDTPHFRLSFRNSQSVEVLDSSMLPTEFVRTKTEPDKTAIRQALRTGSSVPGALLVNRQNLQIK